MYLTVHKPQELQYTPFATSVISSISLALSSLRSNPWSRKGSRKSLLRQKPQIVPGQRNQAPHPPRGDDESLAATLRNTNPQDNSLLAPVHIPEDPHAVLKERHPAAGLLSNSGLVIQRQLEMMNVLLGFEQANRYTILDAQGNHVGYIAEKGNGMGSMMARQWFRTHRSFVTHVFDKHQNEVLRRLHSIHLQQPTKPAAGPLVTAVTGDSARISSLDLSDMRGAPFQISTTTSRRDSQPGASGEFGQFAYVDEPFLSWDFSLRSADSRLLGSVNRNFAGFAREIFTDTGMYALRMDSAALAEEREELHFISQTHKASHTIYDGGDSSGMTLDQRAVMLATAVTIDFDYFSRHSSSSWGLPIPFVDIGGLTGEGAAGGAVGGAAEGTAGAMGRGVAGAGAIAGYEAMQRGASDNNKQQPHEAQQSQEPQLPEEEGEQVEELWGESGPDWRNEEGGGLGSDGPGGTGGYWGEEGRSGDGAGDGDGDDWDDFF
ncbi:hypothetical protein ACJ72_04234 [Emergomyces africanus]|uniref:Phospholipid scramblase n=1 Tax=Emergomyces africanus TaxID=1955775 RepID=A0A1B7NXB8_9EURO|nr:hypothetical protein ACJ72_04234 [Emergomyces africanus]